MYQGEFKNRDNNKTYRVTIGNTGITNIIVDPFDRKFKYNKSSVLFAEDPVIINCERSEFNQQILIRQATINLKSNTDLSSIFFADNTRSIPVIIEEKNSNNYVSIFNGYIDPLEFNQGAAYNFESYTIHATDPLGSLQDLKVNDLPNILRSDIPTIKSLIDDIILAIGCTASYDLWVSSPNKPNDELTTNMSIYYGDSEDSFMNLYDLLNNLLIYQGGMCYYNPVSNKVYLMNMYVSDTTNINFDLLHNAMDDSSNISMSDVYSQVKLKCEIKPNETEINLIDNETIEALDTKKYTSYQKYMTELVAPCTSNGDGGGGNAYQAFKQLLNSTDNEEVTEDRETGYRREHFIWMKKNTAYDFGEDGYTSFATFADQSDYLSWIKQESNIGKGMFVAFGNTDKLKKTDNSPIPNIDMTNYLMISIDGHSDHTVDGHDKWLRDRFKTKFNTDHPICRYRGLESTTLTPTERDITNWIVITGEIILNPIQRRTGPNPVNWWDGATHANSYHYSLNRYTEAKYYFNAFEDRDQTNVKTYNWAHTIADEEGRNGEAYYTNKFWKCTTPSNPVYTLKSVMSNPMIGYMNRSAGKLLPYTKSFYGEHKDDISKLPVLICQLKVGDKYCIEHLEKGQEGIDDFEWLTLEECNTYGIKPWFTIGFDPYNDQYIVGQSWEIGRSISYELNLDADKGIAIPIKIDDKLSGIPEFSIIAPVNLMWKNDTWVPSDIDGYLCDNGQAPQYYIFELIESILVKNLTIKPYTDKGKVREGTTTADNDLVYCSDMFPDYITDNENNIKLCTVLTLEECINAGIKYQMSDSYVYDSLGDPFYGWTYNSDTEIVKPEQMWVDYMYKQYCKPRKVFDSNVKDNLFIGNQNIMNDMGTWMTKGTIIGQIGTNDSYFNKGYITKMEWNLKNRSINVQIREAADYTPTWDV